MLKKDLPARTSDLDPRFGAFLVGLGVCGGMLMFFLGVCVSGWRW